MKIKRNDTVKIISGKDKGKKGKVLKVLTNQNKIVVEKINLRVRHIKKTTMRPGERITSEAPIYSSNAMVICPSCNKIMRVGYHIPENGKKQRICKKCKSNLDQNSKQPK